MSTCRSCGALLQWGVTEKGKRMPLDVDHVTTGTRFAFLGQPIDGIRTCTGDEPGHASHFATCPNAAQHRKPR